jgi:methyl-accepting chemotaxis protein
MQAKIQDMADRGIDVFDRDYQPVPRTQPQKYLTTYVEPFRKELQPVFDEARRRLGSSYAAVVDYNGYMGTHHSDAAQPMTGDPEVDLPRSRQHRIYFTLTTEQRRARNLEPFLLQTYMRDTGEILNDLSMPIRVDGRHWGAMVAGFKPERLLKD